MPTCFALTALMVSRQSRPRDAPHAHARSAAQSSGLRGCPLLTRPTMPRVIPAPLSAWTLPGLIETYPQPSAISCSVAGGSGFAFGGGAATAGGAAAEPVAGAAG